MDIFTHFWIGVLFSIISLRSFSLGLVIYASIMATLPDFDIFLELLRKRVKSDLLLHKGISHSYFAALLVSAITSLIYSLITGEFYLLVFIIGFLFYGIHITLDGLGASKIPLFYPLSKKRYRIFVDRAINIFLAAISGFNLLFYLIAFFVSPEIYFSDLIYYVFSFYIIYFSYKILTKVWVQSRLSKSQKYIPGILPFVYFIYEKQSIDNSILFKLTKKYQFRTKSLKLIESKIVNSSKEMQFYSKALDLSKNYLFFSKWEDHIPIIQDSKDFITMVLILAESFGKNVTYSLKVIFNKINGKIIEISDGFFSITQKH